MSELLVAGAHAPVFLRGEALAAGYNETAITALVRNGTWIRLRHGAYTDHVTWAAADSSARHALLARAVVKQSGADLVLSHETAAVVAHGAPTWGLDLSIVQVTRPDRRAGRIAAGVHQHRGTLHDEDVGAWEGLQVTSACKTALDVTTRATTEVALGLVSHLLHTRRTTAAELTRRYEHMERDPFTLRTDVVLRLASERLASVGESRTYFRIWRAGIAAPRLQHPILDDDGTVVAFLDFAWPERRAWIEFDGRVKYTSHVPRGLTAADVVVAEKAREDLVRRLTGWRCLRLTWADLADAERLARLLRAFVLQDA